MKNKGILIFRLIHDIAGYAYSNIINHYKELKRSYIPIQKYGHELPGCLSLFKFVVKSQFVNS